MPGIGIGLVLCQIPPNIPQRYCIGGPGGIQNTLSCLDLGLSVPKEHIIDGRDRSSSCHCLPIQFQQRRRPEMARTSSTIPIHYVRPSHDSQRL
ncbi:hypothetical protein H4Q26_003462, partial [Puccinia striiformis f. sp. tritici PST-130]